MAAPLSRLQLMPKISSLKRFTQLGFNAKIVVVRRNHDESSSSIPNPAITVLKDGSAIVCWHPPQPFPYECSQPMPRDESDLGEAHSPLNVQLKREDHYRFTPDGPTDLQLKEMFHTTKHRWFPSNKIRRRKPNPPKDRESI